MKVFLREVAQNGTSSCQEKTAGLVMNEGVWNAKYVHGL